MYYDLLELHVLIEIKFKLLILSLQVSLDQSMTQPRRTHVLLVGLTYFPNCFNYFKYYILSYTLLYLDYVSRNLNRKEIGIYLNHSLVKFSFYKLSILNIANNVIRQKELRYGVLLNAWWIPVLLIVYFNF